MSDSENEYADSRTVFLTPNIGDDWLFESLSDHLYWCSECYDQNILVYRRSPFSPIENGLSNRRRLIVSSEFDISRLSGERDEDWHARQSLLSVGPTLLNQFILNNPQLVPRIEWRHIIRWPLEHTDNLEGFLNYDLDSSVDTDEDDLSTSSGSDSPLLAVEQHGSFQSHLTLDGSDLAENPNALDDVLSEVQENDFSNQGAPPASQCVVRDLPLILIEQRHVDNDFVTCSICKENMEVGAMAKELPCQHLFHDSCIVSWLSMRNSCPLCRFELPTDDAAYEAQKHGHMYFNSRISRRRMGPWAYDIGLRAITTEEEVDLLRRNHGIIYPQEDLEASHIERRPHQECRTSDWFWSAASPFVSIMGIVLAFTFGRRLIAAQEPFGNRFARAQLLDDTRPPLDDN